MKNPQTDPDEFLEHIARKLMLGGHIVKMRDDQVACYQFNDDNDRFYEVSYTKNCLRIRFGGDVHLLGGVAMEVRKSFPRSKYVQNGADDLHEEMWSDITVDAIMAYVEKHSPKKSR